MKVGRLLLSACHALIRREGVVHRVSSLYLRNYILSSEPQHVAVASLQQFPARDPQRYEKAPKPDTSLPLKISMATTDSTEASPVECYLPQSYYASRALGQVSKTKVIAREMPFLNYHKGGKREHIRAPLPSYSVARIGGLTTSAARPRPRTTI